jgi:hypothetical protein
MTLEIDNDPDPRRITDNLQSGEPRRIAAGLAELDRAERRLQFVPVPPPDLDSLGTFPRGVPEETLMQFLNVLQNYPRFEPAPNPSEIRRTLVEAVLRHGGEQPIAQVGLNVRTDHFPPYAVRDVIHYLMDRDFASPQEEHRAQMLLTHLLDDTATHDATVDGLVSLALLNRHQELIAGLLPLLNENENERIRAAQE